MYSRNIEIGSQIFINKYDNVMQVKEWVRQFAQSGLKIIRLFIFWDHVEPEEGLWDFTNYDACFEEAELSGLTIVPTLMAVSPPGWMNISSWGQDIADLDDSKYWSKAMDYVAKVVEKYYKSPALHSWILWNEPSRNIPVNENSIKVFREYLKMVYNGDIKPLNRLYFNKYNSFDEVEYNANAVGSLPQFGSYIFSYTESLDWIRFSVHNLCEKLSDIRDEIKKLDTTHPIHINPHCVAQNLLYAGQSIWKEAKIVDFIGCSAHPSYHSNRFPIERIHQSIAYFADLMKSACLNENGEFWVSEMQGGTNIFSGINYVCPTNEDIQHWLWESIGSGASKVLFWCFNRRVGGCEGGEWGLLNQAGLPSERLLAASGVASILKENQELFCKARPRKPDVWLLYSESSWALGFIEGQSTDVKNPRNKQMNADALCGAYLMLADLGYEVGFIDEEKLLNTGLEEESILILPCVTSLSYEVCKALEKFVCSGGTLIADGLCGMKDVNGFVSHDNKVVFDTVFGAELTDIEAFDGNFDIQITQNDSLVKGWFLKVNFKDAEEENIIGRFSAGKPGVVVNKFGRGRAIRIGTVFFQRYLSEQLANNIEFLKSIMPGQRSGNIKLENPSFNLRLKLLETENEDILIILNRGTATDAVLSCSKPCVLHSLNANYEVNIINDDVIIPMHDFEIKIMKVSYK